MIRRSKFWSLALLSLCEVAALALWFSATAVLPSLELEFTLTSGQKSMFTSAVQIGFVVGTLASAALGLAGIAVQTGARSAVASLWSISDASTAELFRVFYDTLDDRYEVLHFSRKSGRSRTIARGDVDRK